MTRLTFTLGLAALLLMPTTIRADGLTFQTVNNSGDPAFNRLLGINNSGTAVGYFGDGTTVPNSGYTVAPPYSGASYTNENFPGAVQTQVVGINNLASPTTVGFWIDGSGNNFGFVDQGGTFTSVTDPSAAGTSQLLGVNSHRVAAGFYLDAGGNAHGFLYNIGTATFTAINFPGATSTTVTGIDNNGVVTGFFTDGTGTHGFTDNGGTFTAFDFPGGTNTMFLGINNLGAIAGSYVDAGGLTHGLLYNPLTNTYETVDDPLASSTAAFGVTGTTINGINDNGQLVGFYSDGTNVNGFVATPSPEPGSLMLISAGLIVLAGKFRKRTV
jgi:hypothetical protein